VEKLFLYAELEKIEGGEPARAVGELRELPNGDGAAQFFDTDVDSWVYGLLKRVPYAHLVKLDRTEKPEFRRTRIMTGDGSYAWAYSYILPSWSKFPRVLSGRWPGSSK
jgi:hypothetical protein